jgi:hypothetical protein
MHPKLSLLPALLLASPLPARAACTPARSVSEANSQEPKILVSFAVPIGLPVATFAPYFYSASQFQPAPLTLPSGEGRGEGAVSARSRNAEPTAATPHSEWSLPAAAGTPHSADSRPPIPNSASLNPEPRTLSPLSAHCTSCHSGPSPKANLSLDHPETLSLTDRLRAIRAVASGQMPKGTHITDNELRALVDELAKQP